jgi:hypothetical protein
MRGMSVMTVVGVGRSAAVREWQVLPMSTLAVEHRGEGEGEDILGGPVIDKQEVDSKAGLVSFFMLVSIDTPRCQWGAA